MMIDVNVLLAAARQDHTHHARAKDWLESWLTDCEAGTQTLSLPLMVIASFLRLITQTKIYPNPSTAKQAVAYVDWLLDVRGVSVGSQGKEWVQLRKLCLDKNLIHNDVPDAWLASLVISNGEVLATFDKGFRKLLPSSQLQIL
jgi:toxin-antitoxin system PIN domain toxin